MMKIYKKFKLLVKKIAYYSLSFFATVLPKKDNIIFFSDYLDIRENQYVLFKYLIDNNYYKKYKIVYSVPDKKQVESYLRENSKVISNFFLCCYYKVVSKYIIYAFGGNRFECIIPKSQIAINLWHGFGLKKIGYCANPRKFFKAGDCFSKVLISSEFFSEMVIKSYDCKPEQLLIGGQPKNDYITSNHDMDSLSMLGINKSDYNRVIIFLPTYRNSSKQGYSGHSSNFPLIDIGNIVELNNYLSEVNSLMIIKLHHAAQLETSIGIGSNIYSNIVFIKNEDLYNKNIPFYLLLSQVDVLLTDYSSVYQDFLLTDKPIGFVVDDIEEYCRIRGFNFSNPLEIMPGYKIYNLDDLKLFISDLINGRDNYTDDRKRINNLVNRYQDNNNCRRLLDYLAITIDEGEDVK